MAKNKKESVQPDQSPVAPSEEANAEFVEVIALRDINTTNYGNVREGKKASYPAEFAQQLIDGEHAKKA